VVATNPDLATRFLRATLRGWEWAVENPAESVDLMLEMFPEMAAEREFHLASFNASIPLIRTGDTPIGWLDCQTKQFHGPSLSEGLCTTDILMRAGEEND
jgi:NitT/TauT family transport system substrate-binding protein